MHMETETVIVRLCPEQYSKCMHINRGQKCASEGDRAWLNCTTSRVGSKLQILYEFNDSNVDAVANRRSDDGWLTRRGDRLNTTAALGVSARLDGGTADGVYFV